MHMFSVPFSHDDYQALASSAQEAFETQFLLSSYFEARVDPHAQVPGAAYRLPITKRDIRPDGHLRADYEPAAFDIGDALGLALRGGLLMGQGDLPPDFGVLKMQDKITKTSSGHLSDSSSAFGAIEALFSAAGVNEPNCDVLVLLSIATRRKLKRLDRSRYQALFGELDVVNSVPYVLYLQEIPDNLIFALRTNQNCIRFVSNNDFGELSVSEPQEDGFHYSIIFQAAAGIDYVRQNAVFEATLEA